MQYLLQIVVSGTPHGEWTNHMHRVIGLPYATYGRRNLECSNEISRIGILKVGFNRFDVSAAPPVPKSQ